MITVEWHGCFPYCTGCWDNLYTELVIHTANGTIRREVTEQNHRALEAFYQQIQVGKFSPPED